MLELMKTRRTENIKIMIEGKRKSKRFFVVPKDKAQGVLTLLLDYEETEKTIPASEVFKHLYTKYGKVGTIVRGYRVREGLTQVDLAKKMSIRQAELSRIENGKRGVGKAMAKRFSAVFKTDYRVFL